MRLPEIAINVIIETEQLVICAVLLSTVCAVGDHYSGEFPYIVEGVGILMYALLEK